MSDAPRPAATPLPHDEAGTGPAVVLLHAGVTDRRMWSEHLPHLAAAGFRAVAPDLPAFGEAPPDQGEQAPWHDVLATMDGLGIERAALVGSSFGGAVALRVAAVAPQRISALGVVSAPSDSIAPSPHLQAAWAAEEEALERGDLDAAVSAVVEAWTLPDAPVTLRERVAAMQRRAFELQASAEPAPEAADPLQAGLQVLSRLDVPVLVAVGEHDWTDFHAAADELIAVLPHARRATVPGAGHLAPLERPEAFRALLLELLRT